MYIESIMSAHVLGKSLSLCVCGGGGEGEGGGDSQGGFAEHLVGLSQ